MKICKIYILIDYSPLPIELLHFKFRMPIQINNEIVYKTVQITNIFLLIKVLLVMLSDWCCLLHNTCYFKKTSEI